MLKYFTPNIRTEDILTFKIISFDSKVIGSDETGRKLDVKILTLRALTLFGGNF